MSFNPRTRVGCDQTNFPVDIKNSFQSTHPCGVRRYLMQKISSGIVSIHAPVWGATSVSRKRIFICGFNPRTRVGCDGNALINARFSTFQSTHPCGVRHDDLDKTKYLGVSIHAPVWGATIVTHKTFLSSRVSIHAPVWGATATGQPLLVGYKFQSTHPCGVRHLHFLRFFCD